jgi:hypothetical protein
MAERRQRAWIKVQFTLTTQVEEVLALVKHWKTERQAAHHLMRAIRLYAALGRGDVSVLSDYFPGLIQHAAPPPSHRPSLAAPTLTLVAKSDAQDRDEALDGLGLEGLDFGQGG